MAITDIVLPQKTTASNPEPETTPVALSSVIKRGQGSLADDPQSGSILKLLSDNGFQNKINEGIKKGHTYTIIHNPPSTEFVLVDSWSEGGETRKKLLPFSIKIDTAVPVKSITPPQPTIEQPSNEPVQKSQEVVVMAPEIPFVAPAQVEAQKVTPSRSWLKEKLGNKSAPEPQPAKNLQSVFGLDEKKTETASVSILKTRFAKTSSPKDLVASSNTSSSIETVVSVTTSNEDQLALRFNKLVESFFGTIGEEWHALKKITLDRFIYPENSAWGLDTDGRIMIVTPMKYPPHAKALYDKLSPIVNKNKDIDLQQTLEQYLKKAVENNLV